MSQPRFFLVVLAITVGVLYLLVGWQMDGVRAAQVQEDLWGVKQECTYPIKKPDHSIDGPEQGFDERTATCMGGFSTQFESWTFLEFEKTSLDEIELAELEVGYFVVPWSEETLHLQISPDGGMTWEVVEEFTAQNAPPGSLSIETYDISEVVNGPETIDQLQMRFVGGGEPSYADLNLITINIDAVRLRLLGVLPPTSSPSPSPTLLPSPTATVLPSEEPVKKTTPVRITLEPLLPEPSPIPVTRIRPTESPTPVGPDITATPTASDPELVPTPSPTPSFTPSPTSTELVPIPTPGAVLNVPLPTSTSAPPFPTATPVYGDPHADNAAMTDSCTACHRSHTASGPVLRQNSPEEAVCFSCHSTDGPGVNVELAFTSTTNTSTRYFKHDIYATNGVHQYYDSSGSAYGGGNRHVECEDCHNPHNASRGAANAPMLPPEMDGASGVDPAWTAEGAPASFTWLPQAEREYQVCFKCHSSFTSLPTYAPDGWDGNMYIANGLGKLTSTDPNQIADSQDIAEEYNPYNASFHPVISQGRNQDIPPASFVPGWSQTSLTYCSDCHTNADGATQGAGPHGSPRLHLLDGNTNYQTVIREGIPPSDQMICFKCHDATTYLTRTNINTNFYRNSGEGENLHGYHMEWGATCYACHDSHGSEQDHLLNFNLSDNIQPLNGADSQSAWFVVGEQRGCSLECHGEIHDGHVNPDFRYP